MGRSIMKCHGINKLVSKCASKMRNKFDAEFDYYCKASSDHFFSPNGEIPITFFLEMRYHQLQQPLPSRTQYITDFQKKKKKKNNYHNTDFHLMI